MSYLSTMASQAPTPFLKLNQWQRSDKPVMEDFNDDNRKIDEGFAALQAENVTLRTELAKKADMVTGSFTSVLYGEDVAGTHTYDRQFGNYAKVGNIVTVNGEIVLTRLDRTMSGYINVGKLPFVPAGMRTAVSIVYVSNIVNTTHTLQAFIYGGGPYFRLILVNGSTLKLLTTNDLTDNSRFIYSATYFTNE